MLRINSIKDWLMIFLIFKARNELISLIKPIKKMNPHLRGMDVWVVGCWSITWLKKNHFLTHTDLLKGKVLMLVSTDADNNSWKGFPSWASIPTIWGTFSSSDTRLCPTDSRKYSRKVFRNFFYAIEYFQLGHLEFYKTISTLRFELQSKTFISLK